MNAFKWTFLLFFINLISIAAFGQKFMIEGKDTLPYHVDMHITKDTSRFDSITGYHYDTTYSVTCHTFERRDGQIINVTNDRCGRQGLWIVPDSNGDYWKGRYGDAGKVGLWSKFDKTGRLLRESETVWSSGKEYGIREIDYSTGSRRVLLNRPVFGFFIQHLWLYFTIILGSFFSRVFINSAIYNSENDTNYSPIYFYAPGYVSDNYMHSLICTFTLWFSDYKPENRRLVLISNTLSLIALITFFGSIIIFTITGDIR